MSLYHKANYQQRQQQELLLYPGDEAVKGCSYFCSSSNNNTMALWGGAATPTNAPSSSSFSYTPAPSSVVVEDVSDADLAREMNALSVEEREMVLEDIHGIVNIRRQDETTEFLTKCLKDFDWALSRIPKKQRRALDRALLFKPSIQYDTKFKLMFLRADVYDARKAANRMNLHYKVKLELFGEEKLVKNITLEDLTSDDGNDSSSSSSSINVLQNGSMFVHPNKDQAGRPVLFCDIGKFNYYAKPSETFRAFWYLTMSTIQDDEEAQLKGINEVGIVSSSSSSNNSNNNSDGGGGSNDLFTVSKHVRQFFSLSGDILMGLPVRPSSIHVCCMTSDPSQQLSSFGSVHHWMPILVSLIRVAVGKHGRLRLRCHVGSNIEVEYALRTFGVNSPVVSSDKSLSSSKQEKLNTKNNNNAFDDAGRQQLAKDSIQHWINVEHTKTLQKRQQEQETGIILYPEPHDVLMMARSRFCTSAGNLRWSQLIDDNLEKYQNCNDKFLKTCISIDIVKTIQGRGGRFLEPYEGNEGNDDNTSTTTKGWIILDEAVAREKTLRAFRPKLRRKLENSDEASTITSDVQSDGGDRGDKRLRLW